MFKAARLVHPGKIAHLRPDTTVVDSLRSLPCLNDVHIIDNLKSELPHYLAAVEDINIDINPLMWWKDKENNLPFWATACRKVLLVQPFSAAVEQVFSLLKGSFSCKQTSALEDYIECSVMLQYNSRN